MLSLHFMNQYAKLSKYPKANDIKEDSQQHLGQTKPGCFLLHGPEGHIAINLDQQPRKYYRTRYIAEEMG
jgi:hypothetical protein